MSVEDEKYINYARIRDVIFNEDNEFRHMKSIKVMVQKFEDDFGVSKESIFLWKIYNKVYNIITKNKIV